MSFINITDVVSGTEGSRKPMHCLYILFSSLTTVSIINKSLVYLFILVYKKKYQNDRYVLDFERNIYITLTSTILLSLFFYFFFFFFTFFIFFSLILFLLLSSTVYHISNTMTPCDTLSPSTFTKHIIYQICLGFSCAVRGFILSWNNTYVWKTQRRSLLSLIGCTLVIYITLVIVFLPFRLIVWLISFAYAFAPSTIEWFEHVSSARTLLFNLITFVPLLAVFTMNNLLGYDKLFFSVLASVNPTLAERLNSRARQSFTSSLYFFLRRTIQIFGIVTCIHFLRSIPYFGRLIPALWVLKYARYTITNTKHVYLRTTFFILLFLLTIFKSLHPYALSLLHIQMASTALARELFDTYLSRIHTHTIANHRPINIKTHAPPSRYHFLGLLVPALFHPLFNWQIQADIDKPPNQLTLPHSKITHFLRENYFTLLAFAIPYIFLFSIPLLGFFCVGFAHGAAAYTLAVVSQ